MIGGHAILQLRLYGARGKVFTVSISIILEYLK